MGLDDSYLGAFTIPPFTTIRLSGVGGDLATADVSHVIVTRRLVARGSTAVSPA